jgi:hypothetical protein
MNILMCLWLMYINIAPMIPTGAMLEFNANWLPNSPRLFHVSNLDPGYLGEKGFLCSTGSKQVGL